MVTLSSRLDRVIESQTLAMTKKARELKEKGNDVISLSIGEPDFDTPINICNEATAAMSRGETHYPPVLGTLAFRQAIQNKLLIEKYLKHKEVVLKDQNFHLTPPWPWRELLS
jgi:aspartate aminotransferase